MLPRDIPSMLIAIDPGPHTGVAQFVEGKLVATRVVALPELDAQYRTLYDLLFEAFGGLYTNPVLSDPMIVIEDYRSQMTLTREGYYTIQLIGFLAGTARVAGYPATLQLPPVRRPWLEDAVALCTLCNGKRPSPHERDATAHGLAYLRQVVPPTALVSSHLRRTR